MKIVIAGAYDIGRHLARLLSRNNQDIVLIDNDVARLDSVGAEYDIMSLQGEVTDISALKEADVAHAALFIGVTPFEHQNLTACMLARRLGAKRTVARIDNHEYISQEGKQLFNALGIDSLIYPEMLAAQNIANGLRMSWVRQRWDVHGGALVMLGIKLREGCTILNRPLKELCGPDDPYHVVAIKRRKDTIIPGGNDSLELYDLAYFMTTKQYIPYIRRLVGKEHYVNVRNVMIMGGGKTAVRLCKLLPDYMQAKVIETNAERCDYLNDILDTDRVMVINGDGRDIPLLTEESIGNTQAFVAVTGNAETNILACLTAKRFGVRKTAAMVENIDYVSTAEELDIGTIVNRKTITASHIYQMMLDEDVQNIRFLMTASADVIEFNAHQGSKVTRKRVFELGLPQGATIGGLVRHGEGMLVSGGTQIEAGDTVVLFCHDVNIKKLETFFK